MFDHNALEVSHDDDVVSPLAEFGRALISISEGSSMWGAFVQTCANVANAEGNTLWRRARYSTLCAFCDRMSARSWRLGLA